MMSKPLRKKLFHSFLVLLISSVSYASMAFMNPCAGADPQTHSRGIGREHVTLSPSAVNSGNLISDSAKSTRLHDGRQGAAAVPVQPLSTTTIENALTAAITGPKTSAAVAGGHDSIRALVGEDNGKINARILYNKRNGTPRMIKIQDHTRAKSSNNRVQQRLSVDAANQFLTANRELLRIDDPEEELTVKKKWTDSLGSHHVRYQQRFQGLPVWGREACVHMDGTNRVYLFQGVFEPSPRNAEKNFAIDEQQAREAACRHLGLSDAAVDAVKSIERVWYTRPNGRMVTAYGVEVEPDLLQRWVCFVDGATGQVLHRISRINNEIYTTSATDLNGVVRTFTAWNDPEMGELLLDPTIPLNDPPHAPVPTRESGDTYILDARNQTQIDMLYYFAGPDWDPEAVSMVYHIKVIDGYYKRTFNRQGIDNHNLNNLLLGHVGENYANAFWNGTFIVFGDGDNQLFSNLCGALDITAHEYTHGVVEFTAGLLYENQSGALNEALADIFACMVDRDDWTIGEQVTLAPPFYLRNLADPSDGVNPLPTKMSEYRNFPVDQDHGGVHVNCGIPARAAYLMAEGLSAQNLGTSIGRDKTEQIFYRALSVYLTQASNFLDAREATIQAAQDLYGAREAGSVQAAWDVVEVAGDPQPDDQTPTDPVSGDDMMVYLRPADSQGDAFDVYAQQIPQPFQGYDPSMDRGPLNSMSATEMRPSVITVGENTMVFYVGTDHNLYCAVLDGEEMPITDSGDVHSMAISPDGRYFAYTREDETDNTIYVGNLDTGTMTPYELASPDTTLGETGIQNTTMNADSLSFDYTSHTLVFDAFNKLTIGSSGEEYTYWTIGCLDLNTGQFSWPFPNQNPNFDIGNPSFAYNNGFVIALDVIDYATDPATPQVWTMDLAQQIMWPVATSNPQHYNFSGMVCGVPSFWGSDDAITMQIFDPERGSLAFKVPLYQWEGLPDDAVQLNDSTLVKGAGIIENVIYHGTG